MSKLTAAICASRNANTLALIRSLAHSGVIAELLLFGERTEEVEAVARPKGRWFEGDPASGAGLARLLAQATGEYLLLFKSGEQLRLGPNALERFLAVAEDSGAGLIYSDFRDDDGDPVDHPLIDYQSGSIRDSFDLGPLVFVSRRAFDAASARHGRADASLRWGAMYEQRLKISIDSQILRIPEPLYSRMPTDPRTTGERQFDYVDPRQREYQLEMERIATEHLKRIGAFIDPASLNRGSRSQTLVKGSFPVRASIVIPVRNRERTIADAINSAVCQSTHFPFNVIVVDNHSTDRTSEIIQQMARTDSRVVHIRPGRTDLGIGGCWNEALFSTHCGEFAVQLDSDDLYADERTLATIIAKFDEGDYVMVIGSYAIVDFDLKEIPPGIIDHREWTRENGHNNALRVNGLGAPRSFWVPLLRQLGGMPNTSYGEDYAVALRICREHEIGRIYESLYYARRWEGNSDAALPLPTANRYDSYKDYLRSVEIRARQKLNERRSIHGLA
jgi:hypothetical protein